MTFDPRNLRVAQSNGALTDLFQGESVRDGDGERAKFVGYGDNAPLYVNLDYPRYGRIRLPNSGLRRCR